MLNKVKLSGIVASKPKFEEKFGGEKIYGFVLKSKKPNKDEYYEINIRISDRFDCFSKVEEGVFIELTGSIRSVNKRVEGCTSKERRLIVSVFCNTVKVLDDDSEFVNTAEIIGYIHSEPFFMEASDTMPQRCDMLMMIKRSNKKVSYLPITFRGRNAEFVSNMEVGQMLKCEGRLQTRDYTKTRNGVTKNYRVTEFVVRTVEPLDSPDE